MDRRARRIDDPIERLRYLRARAAAPSPQAAIPRRRFALLGIAVAALPLRGDLLRRISSSSPRPPAPYRLPSADSPNVWPVEHTPEFDLFSNGLRVENRLEVANEPRSYQLTARETFLPGPRGSQPAGIVFHTTESEHADFEPRQKPELKRIGREVLLYCRQRRAYHFVIDRFGRVHRVVAESDAANHAGHSVWADARWLYFDLNHSFLGVAFETRTEPGEAPATPGQLRAARSLTEALRSRYNIPAENCVTHAQVSVNPSNMRIGWHTDWASRFPFSEVGLPDNYRIPLPSLYLCGFEYDPAYTASADPGLQKAVAAADDRVRDAAAERRIGIPALRRMLRQKYEATALRPRSATQENTNE